MISSIRELKIELDRALKNCSNVFIVGHDGPDFDAIGSSIGLHELATNYEKDAYIIIDDDETKIEPGVKRIMDMNDNRKKYHIIKKKGFLNLVNNESLLIITDANKYDMISVGDSLNLFNEIFIIDHHSVNEKTVQTKNKFITTDVSSSSEIVAKLLNCSKVKYDSNVANYLLAGISLDTNRFKKNTSSETHDVAEKLIKHKANIDFVNDLFLEEFESYCKISNLIINGTIIRKYGESLLYPIQVSFTLNRNQPSSIYLKEDLAKAADKMMKFNGIDASFCLGFVDDKIIHISARGGKKVDVGNIMSAMGGGGTPQSAGGRIESTDIFKVEDELMDKVLNELFPESNIEEPQVIKVKQIEIKS